MKKFFYPLAAVALLALSACGGSNNDSLLYKNSAPSPSVSTVYVMESEASSSAPASTSEPTAESATPTTAPSSAAPATSEPANADNVQQSTQLAASGTKCPGELGNKPGYTAVVLAGNASCATVVEVTNAALVPALPKGGADVFELNGYQCGYGQPTTEFDPLSRAVVCTNDDGAYVEAKPTWMQIQPGTGTDPKAFLLPKMETHGTKTIGFSNKNAGAYCIMGAKSGVLCTAPDPQGSMQSPDWNTLSMKVDTATGAVLQKPRRKSEQAIEAPGDFFFVVPQTHATESYLQAGKHNERCRYIMSEHI